MGLINSIFDFYQQQYRIDQLQEEATRTREEATNVRGAEGRLDIERLERALGEVALPVKTNQRVMVEKGMCTTEELQQKLRAIHLEDGRADGCAPIG